MRPVLAFFVTPVPAAVLLGITVAVRIGAVAALFAIPLLIIMAWLLQLLPGLQIAAWLARMHARAWWHFVLGGIALYAFPIAAYVLWWAAHHDRLIWFPWFGIANLLGCGIASGLTCWAVLRPGFKRAATHAELVSLNERFD